MNHDKRDRDGINNEGDKQDRKRNRRGFSEGPQLIIPSAPIIDKSIAQIAQELASKYSNTNEIISNIPNPTTAGCRIYVGAVNDISESDIKALFSQFGSIVKIHMRPNQSFVFIDYAHPEYAKAAMIMDHFDINGKKIKVGWPSTGTDNTNNSQALTLHPSIISAKEQAQALLNKALTIVGGEEKVKIETKRILIKNIHRDIDENELKLIFSPFGKVRICSFTNVDGIGTRGSNLNVKTAIIEYSTIISSEVAAKDMNGFSLAGYNLLVDQTLLKPTPAVQEKRICVLENMVTIEDSTDPSLKEEIAEEAQKFGKLSSIDIYVDPSTKKVKVRLQYEDSQSATKAFNTMNDRFFAGNRISASLV